MDESRGQSSGEDEIALNENNNTLKDFILLFETFPSLWNPNNKNYLNTVKKNEDLDKLLPIFRKMKPNATKNDVKKKLNSLRSNYRKELKKIENSKRSGCGADNVYKPRSSTFYLLQFLAKIETPKLIKGNTSCEAISEEDNSLVFSSIGNESPPVKIRKTSGTLLSKQNELLSRACSLLSQPQPSVSSQDVDPLALVWSDKLKHLNPTQKLFAEKAIIDILFEAQLNNLHKNSVQINSTHSSPATSTPYLHTTPSPVKIAYTTAPDKENLIPPFDCETYASTNYTPVSYENLNPADYCETQLTLPGNCRTYKPVLPELNLPSVHAQKTTSTTHQKPKPVIHIQKSNLHHVQGSITTHQTPKPKILSGQASKIILENARKSNLYYAQGSTLKPSSTRESDSDEYTLGTLFAQYKP